jgi:acyl-CoA thioester hydrolase
VRLTGVFAPRAREPALPSRIAVEHTERRRVAWADTDAGGRIHFTAVFRYAEAAETAWRRGLGLLEDWGDYPRRRVEADYLAVLRFEDEVDVRLAVDRVGTTSITFAWTIDRDGERCVEGRHTVVHVDGRGRAAPLPDGVRAALLGR